MRRIDVHHHFFPSDLQKEKTNKDVGWLTPAENLPWTPALSLKSMDESGIDYAILSLPALTTGTVSSENRTKARERNIYASDICKAHPQRFGFFATLPFLDDLTGVLAEVSYALDELNADGFALSSSQGEGICAKYIGDETYDSLWAELDRRKAVVFLHGAQVPSSTPCPHALLGVPITEVPNETFKAAAHLVVTGRKRKYPNVKVILAHLGGSTPFLAARVAILSRHMGCTLTPEEIVEDFRSFYYETALSAYTTNLQAMDGFIPRENLLFGTDFPAVSTDMASWYTRNLEEHYRDDRDKLNAVMYGNALELFAGKKIQDDLTMDQPVPLIEK